MEGSELKDKDAAEISGPGTFTDSVSWFFLTEFGLDIKNNFWQIGPRRQVADILILPRHYGFGGGTAVHHHSIGTWKSSWDRAPGWIENTTLQDAR